MFTLDKNYSFTNTVATTEVCVKAAPVKARSVTGKTALTYLFITLFCVLFGAVYEIFSHGVFSYFMIYAFVIPLVLGMLPFLMMNFFRSRYYPPLIAGAFYHFGVAILTVGSLMTGVLEIYGTSNALTAIYWIAGAVSLAAGICLSRFRKRR